MEGFVLDDIREKAVVLGSASSNRSWTLSLITGYYVVFSADFSYVGV